MKKLSCPFCLEKFNSRKFLLNQHTPVCNKREAYFNKLLDIREMDEIKTRLHGGIIQVEEIKTKTFVGKAFPKEEVESEHGRWRNEGET